jgi:hypothetical protein
MKRMKEHSKQQENKNSHWIFRRAVEVRASLFVFYRRMRAEEGEDNAGERKEKRIAEELSRFVPLFLSIHFSSLSASQQNAS